MYGSRTAYFACMVLATIVAGWWIRRWQARLPIEGMQKLGIAVGGLIGATFAAKLPFILGADPSAGVIAAWLSDGKTILWGLTGGYIGVEVAKWALHIQVATGDTFVIPIAVAVAIGRLGCFLYGCCYGVETNQAWGFRFSHAPDAGALLRHPAQLYEMVFHLSFAVLAAVAITGARNQTRLRSLRGDWMPLYLIVYSVFRFVSEYRRPENRDPIGFTFYQWSSIAIALGFVSLLFHRKFRLRRKPDLLPSINS